MGRRLHKISNWSRCGLRNRTRWLWNTHEFRRMVVRYRPWRFVAQRRVRDHRGPGVKLLFRPTFTPAAARVTFDWTATPNWFRLKSLPLTEPRLPPPRPRLDPFHRCAVHHPRLSPLSRAFVLPLPPTLRPSILILAPSPYSSPVPAMVHRLRLFLNLIRDYGASLQTAPNVFPPSPFFYRPLANVRKINCRPVRSEMRERRTRHVGGRVKRKLGGCRFYVKSDLCVERYADDNSIKRLRCKNWYLCFSLFCF